MRTESQRLAWGGFLMVLLGALMITVLAGAQPNNRDLQSQDQVEINSATVEDLQKVPGIGPTLAGRIVEFREEHGPFERIEDLLNVQGIGERTLERMRPYLKVEIPKSPK
jgi:comEA protein